MRGGRGSAAVGRFQPHASRTECRALLRWICSVVRIAQNPPVALHDSVSHWCCASAVMTVPSLNSTSKHGRSTITSVAATTLVGLPSAPIRWWPTSTAPMVVHPVGVGSGVSSASALPTPGRAATMIIWPGCRPLVSSSRSANPVGMPRELPPREAMASISSMVGWSRSSSAT